MFDPPPGFDDLLGDCEKPTGYQPLAVDGVGAVLACKPRPDALGDLAMSNNPQAKPEQRSHHGSIFVQNQLADGEYARLLAAMMDDELPADTIQQVGQALATWGTARPYRAVISLSLMAAKNWRAIRYRLLDKGITDPMALPSIHPILDLTEQAVLESIQSDNADADKMERQQLTDLLYRPDPPRIPGPRGKAPPPAPDGFDDAETFNSFASFAAAAAR